MNMRCLPLRQVANLHGQISRHILFVILIELNPYALYSNPTIAAWTHTFSIALRKQVDPH